MNQHAFTIGWLVGAGQTMVVAALVVAVLLLSARSRRRREAARAEQSRRDSLASIAGTPIAFATTLELCDEIIRRNPPRVMYVDCGDQYRLSYNANRKLLKTVIGECRIAMKEIS